MNAHLEQAYAGSETHRIAGALTNSELAQSQTIMLPMYAQMSEDDANYVVLELEQAIVQSRASLHRSATAVR